MNETDQTITSSIRRHLWGGGLFLCSLLAFMTGWAAWMEISGAIIAPGAIMVETNVKTIKHKEGGIIGRILIKNGDLVSSGDLLIRLDDAVTRANLAVVYKQIDELTATEARLVAERDGLDEIAFPATLSDRIKDPAIARIVTDQKQWKMARTSAFSGRIDQLTEQVNQLESQIVSLNIQSTAKADEIALVSQELDSLEILSRKKYVANNRVLAVRREKARLTGEHGALLQEATRTGLAISERKIQVLQMREDNLADILQQLNTTRSELAQLEEQKLVAEDQLSRMNIRAPRDGYVHQLSVHTKGGYIASGEPVMQIVPKEDSLVIETQVAPTDVDQIYSGQPAIVRLPGLNQRTTPELKGIVTTVSAETSQDEVTGLPYFTVRMKLAEGEEARVTDSFLLPGMPVEALIRTTDRTILSYLLKPLHDHIVHAFREE